MNSNASSHPSEHHTGSSFKSPYSFWLLSLAIVFVSCLLNFGGINNTEVIDDHDLLHNTVARGCGKNPIACFQRPQFGLYYRPVMGVSFSIGENLHGQMPYPFHVENLLLHAAVIFLALWMFWLLFRNEHAALVAGILFAFHPLQVPITTFIGGRTDSLALFFLLWFAIGALQAQGGKAAVIWRTVSLVAFTFAVFTKEQCALLVLLAPLLLQRDPDRSHQPGRIPWWAVLYTLPILALLICARIVIPPQAVDTVSWKPTTHTAAWDAGLRIEMVGRTLNFYLRSFLWPSPDTLHQSSLGDWDIPQPLTALVGFLAAGIWLGLLRHIWPDRRLRVLGLWTTLTLLPCLNIITIPSQFVACYRAAIPLFGIAGLAGAALAYERPSEKQPFLSRPFSVMWRWVGPASLALFFIFFSLADVPAWQSDIAIEKAEYHADPNFLPALGGWAIALHREGRANDALPLYDRVLEQFFSDKSSTEEKIALAKSAWMLRRVKSHSSLRYQAVDFLGQMFRGRGGTKQMTGRYDAAIEDYKVAIALHPDDYEVADWMTQCYILNGRFHEAETHLKRLIAVAPNGSRFFTLGRVYYREGRFHEARDTLATALSRTSSRDQKEVKSILQWWERADALSRMEVKPIEQ